MKIAVIGAGISGVSLASFLEDRGHQVVIYEKNTRPGGLVQCDVVNGNLFHKVGGHVFNAKDQGVSDWFWNHFDKEAEFIKAERNAKIFLNGRFIGYPLENHLYQLDSESVQRIVNDLLDLQANGYQDPYSYANFEAFLKGNFGQELYDLYFRPYNEKIWHTELKYVPMRWLEGKLPMPDFNKIFLSNITRAGESEMVHSTFYYPKKGGSQFIIDRLAKGVTIECSKPVDQIHFNNGKWVIHNTEFDHVVYTGDIRVLQHILKIQDKAIYGALKELTSLISNGTSNMLCETDDTALSWLYLPGPETLAHRIIYTGNFSSTNNAPGRRRTCVVEFSGKVDEVRMRDEIRNLPGNLVPVAFNQEANSYIIQQHDTRSKIQEVKDRLQPLGFYLTGRFAEWEYYNMDKAIEAAMGLSQKI